MKSNFNLLAAAAILCLAACTVEQPYEAAKPAEPQEITIQATWEGDENPETKTALDAGTGAILWVPGDAISLFYGSGSGGGSQFTSNASEPSAITNFTGTITAITGGADVAPEDTYFWGVYPYRPDTSCDGTTVTMTLPSQQTAVSGTFSTGLFPSIGRSQGLVMGFYNVCGGWRFSVTKEGVRKVTLKSNGGELIAGKVKVALNESGIPALQEILDGTDEVVLECPAGEYFEVGKNYYITLLPTTFTSGFTMTFETYTEEGVYNRTAKTTITRSKFSGITKLDNYLTTPYAKKTGNISIPDANFKAYMVANFDTNGDGEISYEEADAITTIDVNTDNIYSVEGIEYCKKLMALACYGSDSWSSDQGKAVGTGQLTSLDVSNNTALTRLDCYGNQLTSLDVSNNTTLTNLGCFNNQLASLDVSKNTALRSLSCSSNQLTSIDVSNNTALSDLNCPYNQLISLDVSNNTALTRLDCYNNQLTSLDVSKNTALTSLHCYYNQLTDLDVSKNTALTRLDCYGNQLTSLDVSNNTALTRLECWNNQLASLDVSNNTALTKLSCGSNQLTSLDVSNNTALTKLSCGSNQLTSLDVSNNTALTDLGCFNNQLTSLDVSNNTALTWLSCGSNQLTSLDVSNTALTYLSCGSNHLTSLDVSNNTALTWLDCGYNQLTSLDLSNNTALTSLYCEDNQLTSLDVSNNIALTYLDCSRMASLSTLLIAQGQEIPNVTVNRSTNYIPEMTQIVVAPSGGGSEGTDDEEVNP